VSAAETASEPRQPRRLEKKRNTQLRYPDAEARHAASRVEP
jgi:hypothetical protein